MKRHFRFVIADSLLLSPSQPFAGGVILSAEILFEDEDESTRARGCGQSPRLVQ
jgi:hypothetical protein